MSAAYQKWNEHVVITLISGVQVHDARIVAIMLMHAIAILITYNVVDFKRFAEIEARSPKALLNR